MHRAGKNSIIQYHRSRLDREGTLPLGWRDEHTQRVRFEALCEWGDLEDLSVLDLGCGKADLMVFFEERGISVRYTGVEMVPEFVQEANVRFKGYAQARILQGSFMEMPLPPCDVAFLSGSLNYQTPAADEPWASLRRIWEKVRLGMAFNMLDEALEPSTALLRSFNPEAALRFARELDPEARLLKGYHPEDFTLLLKHRRQDKSTRE